MARKSGPSGSLLTVVAGMGQVGSIFIPWMTVRGTDISGLAMLKALAKLTESASGAGLMDIIFLTAPGLIALSGIFNVLAGGKLAGGHDHNPAPAAILNVICVLLLGVFLISEDVTMGVYGAIGGSVLGLFGLIPAIKSRSES